MLQITLTVCVHSAHNPHGLRTPRTESIHLDTVTSSGEEEDWGVERERGKKVRASGEGGREGRWRRIERDGWSPRGWSRESLVRCLLLTSHSSSPGYSTMRGYQYPLTDTDVGQFATNVFITSVVLSYYRRLEMLTIRISKIWSAPRVKLFIISLREICKNYYQDFVTRI